MPETSEKAHTDYLNRRQIDSWLTARTSRVRTTAPSAKTPFRGNVFALKLKNQTAGLKIDSETTIPLWEGERMDDGMAVEGLLQLE